MAAEQGEDARITARAHNGGYLAKARNPVHFRLVREKGFAVQARALH
ncbi:hypothetical protein GCM10027514_35530 [Azotobacter armeniacus]